MVDVPAFHCGRGHGQQVSTEAVPLRAYPLRPQNRQHTHDASRGNASGKTFISRAQLLYRYSHCSANGRVEASELSQIATGTPCTGRTPPLTMRTPRTPQTPHAGLGDIALRAGSMSKVAHAQCNLPPPGGLSRFRSASIPLATRTATSAMEPKACSLPACEDVGRRSAWGGFMADDR